MYILHIKYIGHICNILLIILFQEAFRSVDVPFRSLAAMSNQVMPAMLPEAEIKKVSLHKGIAT